MTQKEALRLVYDLANQNALSQRMASENDLADAYAAQQTALGILWNMILSMED